MIKRRQITKIQVTRLPHEPLPTSQETVVVPKVIQGRPPIYDDKYHPKMVTGYRLLGLTVEQIAALFGVDVQTVYAWRLKYPSFSQAWMEGGDDADARVAAALNHRACGYTHRAVHISTQMVGGEWRDHIVEYDKHYPPDTAAALKWLGVRQKQWRLAVGAEETASNTVVVKVIGGLPESG